MDSSKSDNYNKRPLWQWVLIYGVIGLIVYGLIYYFVLGKKGDTVYNPVVTTPPPASSQTASPSATQSEQIVTLAADGFTPQSLTIKIGDTVTWVNNSGSAATINSSPHPAHTDYLPLNLDSFPDGSTLSLAFPDAGTYKYHNHLNPSQFGTIVVQ